MDIVKGAIEWAKGEILSAIVLIVIGLVVCSVAFGFYQLGKTEVAKAYIVPMSVVGAIILMAGFGFYFSNKTRLSNFESEFNSDSKAFVQSEIVRAEKTIQSYQNVAFKVFPAIVVVSAILFIFLTSPLGRAICVATIIFMITLIILDTNANRRMVIYLGKLKSIDLENLQ